MRARIDLPWLVAALALVAAGCFGSDPADPDPGGDPTDPGPADPADPGDPADPADPGDPGDPADPGAGDDYPGGAEVSVDLEDLAAGDAALRADLAALEDLDAAGLLARHPVSRVQDLGYDPMTADNLDLIQASAVALDDAELERLGRDGFVISTRQTFPTFGYGYTTLYGEHLPLYVTLDSVLEAVHRSYDDILQALETVALIPELGGLLDGMRANLAADAADGVGDDAVADVDFYLAVAKSALDGEPAAPVAGGDAAAVTAFLADIAAEQGFEERELFGVRRNFDFSQFRPRGHYTASEELSRYFRAMMWLGRIDFRLVEVDAFGKLIFHRRQVEAATAVQALLGDAERASFERIDGVVEAFVGESDYMTVPQLSAFLSDAGVDSPAALSDLDDQTLAQVLVDGDYGAQRISSHIMINGLEDETLPLNRSFLIFGQRYVVDSHVFSNVVFDRVLPPSGTPMRMMPNPLDIAYAALGNDQGAELLEGELETYGYAPALESMRVLVDDHGQDFWDKNLYNMWLSSLRGMSPAAAAPADGEVLPTVARTEAWGRRVLNTQLASWAELRHDTILYAKQSYTAGVACDFPDGYVDPYPAAWAALERFARRGHELVVDLPLDGDNVWLADRALDYFLQLEGIVSTLREMSEYARTQTPFTDAHLAFINEAVALAQGCGGPEGTLGWYGRLHFNNGSSIDFDPVVADVHTQPTDEGGSPVGRILHVGSGMTRLMVVTADQCSGPRAYAGLVSSYHERITEDFDRLTDERWAEGFDAFDRGTLTGTPPDEVPWMADLL